MHKAAKTKLDDFLEVVKVYEGISAFWFFHKSTENCLKPLYEVLKSINPSIQDFIQEEDIGFIICDEITKHLRTKTEVSGKISTIERWQKYFNSDEIEPMKSKIMRMLDSIPLEYKLILTLGESSCEGFKNLSLEMGQGLNLVGVDPKALPIVGELGIYPRLSAEYYEERVLRSGSHLAIIKHFKGYTQNAKETYSVNKALESIDMFISLGIIFGLFAIRKQFIVDLVSQKYITIVNKNNKFVGLFNLPYDKSKTLHNLIIIDRNNFASEVIHKTKHINSYLDLLTNKMNEDAKEFTNKINNILYWFLTGTTSTNQTLGFISLMTCFESCYSGPDESREKDQTLTKKASYFIAFHYGERRQIYLDLEKIRILRNKVIHEGFKLESDEDLLLKSILIEYLKTTIAKELIMYLDNKASSNEVI